MTKRAWCLLFSATLLLISAAATAQDIFTGTGNWSNPARWSAGVPAASQSVEIAGTCTLNVTPPTLGNFAVDASATLTKGGAVSLSIGGNVTIAAGATFDTTIAITMTGAVTTLSSTPTIGNLTVAGGASVTLNSPINLAGTGGLIINGSLDANSTGSYSIALAGSWNSSAGTFIAEAGTVTFNVGAAQTVNSVSAFNNVVVSGTNTLTVSTNPLAIGANLTVNSGATLNLGTATGTGPIATPVMTVGGSLSVTGTLTAAGIAYTNTGGTAYAFTVGGSTTINTGGLITTGNNTILLTGAASGLIFAGGTLDFSGAANSSNTTIDLGSIGGNGTLNAGDKGPCGPKAA